MKDRRPRKLKKVLKKRYQQSISLKIIQSALSSVFAAMQVNIIQSKPIPNSQEGYAHKAEKTLAIVDTVQNAALSITQIMSEKPTNWREVKI